MIRQVAPEVWWQLRQGIQHFLLARSWGLLLSQYISAEAIYGFEADAY